MKNERRMNRKEGRRERMREKNFVGSWMSISPTFFAGVFCTNVFFGSFSLVMFGLAPKFCAKNVRI